MRITRWVTVLIVVLLAGPARAQVPLLLTQHGVLSQGGTPVEGSVPVSFRLYDGALADLPFWEETIAVSCANGYYSVLLGQTVALDPSDLAAASELWLGLSIDGAAELAPRLQVASVPYALASGRAASAAALDCQGCVSAPMVAFGYAGSAEPGGPASGLQCSEACVEASEIANGTITTAKLADGAVTGAKVADGSLSDADIAPGAAIAASKLNRAGLDADLLDGQHAASFASAAHTHRDGGAFPLGTSIYNAYATTLPVAAGSSGGYSLLPLHLKTNWTCGVDHLMYNLEFKGHHFMDAAPINLIGVGYLYGSLGLTYVGWSVLTPGVTGEAYCAADGKLVFKLSTGVDWHASDLVLNLIGGGSSYHATAATSFAIIAAQHSASNW